MAGRRTKLTPRLQAKIAGFLAAGNTREIAATMAGVHRSSFFDWMSKGRADTAPKLYRDLVDAVELAEAAAVAHAVRTVQRAALTNVAAAQWWLERRHTDDWGRKDRVQVEALMEREAERIARDLGAEKEEILALANRILAGGT
jgi:hypothetical protein